MHSGVLLGTQRFLSMLSVPSFNKRSLRADSVPGPVCGNEPHRVSHSHIHILTLTHCPRTFSHTHSLTHSHSHSLPCHEVCSLFFPYWFEAQIDLVLLLETGRDFCFPIIFQNRVTGNTNFEPTKDNLSDPRRDLLRGQGHGFFIPSQHLAKAFTWRNYFLSAVIV